MTGFHKSVDVVVSTLLMVGRGGCTGDGTGAGTFRIFTALTVFSLESLYVEVSFL